MLAKLWGVLLVAVAQTSAAHAESLPRLVVKNVETSDVDASFVQPLGEFILTEFQNTERYQVIGGSDVVAMLENEAQKQLVGCEDDDCLAQIAGAMDAELIASSSVGRVGESYLVSIKIISVRETKVVARASVRASDNEDALMSAAKTAVRTVTATSTFLDELPSVTALPLTLWGGAVAALGTGIAFGIKTQAHHREFNDPTFADVEGAERAGRQSQLVANLAFGTAILSAGAGLLTWWLGGERVEILPDAAEASPTIGGAR